MGKVVTLAKANADGSLSTTDVPIEQAAEWIQAGYHPQTEGEGQEANQAAIDHEKYGGVQGAVATGLTGAASAISGGLSDVGLSALGGGETLRGLRSENPGSNLAGNIAGTAVSLGAGGGAPALFGKAGKLAGAALEGDGLLAKLGSAAVAGGTEGGLYGLSSGVADLADSGEPITGEHVASVLGTKMLLTGLLGGGLSAIGKGAELGLSRASEALRAGGAAKGAIDSIPEDLAGLDAKGLREADAAEVASLKSQATEEKASLEELRVSQRQEIAKQVEEMHHELMEERPIFKAVAGDDVRALPGVKDIASELNGSYKALRSAFNDPIGVAENPNTLLKPLRMRQSALEELQAKAPEVMSVIGADARAGSLQHVDGALEQTRNQIAAIKQLDSRLNPVTGQRLTELESGVSARRTAIADARDALANAPDKGFVQKSAEGAAFAGGTAFAHMIPGVGIAAPFVGKYASEAVGSLFGKLAGTGAKAAKATANNIDRFLNVTTKLPSIAPPLASGILSTLRYAAPGAVTKEPEGGKYTSIQDSFRDRSAELRSKTMYDPTGQVVIRPEVRQQIGDSLKALAAVNPVLADKTETVAVRKLEYTSSMIPRKPEMGGVQIGPDNWSPSTAQIMSFARTCAAVEDPAGVEQRLAHGTITTEDAEAYRTCYPERFKALEMAIVPKLASLKAPIPMARRISLQIFLGRVIDPSCSPEAQAVFQGNFKNEAGSQGGTQAPMPQPNFGRFGSIKKSIEGPTPSQKRGG